MSRAKRLVSWATYPEPLSVSHSILSGKRLIRRKRCSTAVTMRSRTSSPLMPSLVATSPLPPRPSKRQRDTDLLAIVAAQLEAGSVSGGKGQLVLFGSHPDAGRSVGAADSPSSFWAASSRVPLISLTRHGPEVPFGPCERELDFRSVLCGRRRVEQPQPFLFHPLRTSHRAHPGPV